MQNQINKIVEKNKRDWNSYSEKYMGYNLSDKMLKPILDSPSNAFNKTTWEQMNKYIPDFKGKKICVPSSGDNHAVFAFALMGAKVTSCDISENQLAAAKKVANQMGIDQSIRFICTDTMRLDEVETEAYDFVYTSNGVHVWLNDLPAMYHNVHRILKPNGIYIMYEIHPFQRPFDDNMKVVKPYDHTGPFEDEYSVNFHWRIQDFLNAILDAGFRFLHIEEIMHEKDYEQPFWKYEDLVNGAIISKEEVDRMYDINNNPAMALPEMICVVGRK